MVMSTPDIITPIGILRHGMFTDMGPAWLRLDGATEYKRAMYPVFLERAKDSQLILPGSTAATFKCLKVPAGYATVASGFDLKAGDLIGSDSVTLLAENMPEHDHSYTDSTATATAGKASVLTSVLTVLAGLTTTDPIKRTAKAGQAKPTPVPIKPPGFVAHLFVFAGRPRA